MIMLRCPSWMYGVMYHREPAGISMTLLVFA